jgi:uncharacterized membrane protein
MSEHVFFISIGLVLGTILMVFGMKYLSAARQAQANISREEAYRQLAEKAAAAQSSNAASLLTLQTEVAEVRSRLVSIERILKEVE